VAHICNLSTQEAEAEGVLKKKEGKKESRKV
jgi:hypothetical protein